MPITQCHIIFHDSKRNLQNLTPIQCKSVHSFSPIYAISSFLINIPSLSPSITNATKQEILVNTTKHFNPMFEAWNEYLVTCVTNNASYRQLNKFYISIPISTAQYDALVKEEIFLDHKYYQGEFDTQNNRLEHIFGIKIPSNKKRIGLLANQPVFKQNYFVPRIDVSSNLLNLFNNQEWIIFDTPKGHIPTIDQLVNLDAVLVSGSNYSVLNKSQSMQLTIDNLGAAIKKVPHLKVVGICYGHQLILQHYGAIVRNKQPVERLEKVELIQSEIKNHPILAAFKQRKDLLMCQTHSDFVQTLPQGFQLLGQSGSCKVQCSISKDGRIFTSQFHWQVFYHTMQLFFSQEMERGLPNFSFQLKETEDKILRNLEDSQLIIQLMTTFLS